MLQLHSPAPLSHGAITAQSYFTFPVLVLLLTGQKSKGLKEPGVTPAAE
jgi:hypothetical protein